MAIPLVGRNVAVAVDGYDFTGNGNEIKLKRDAAKIDATVFGQHFSYDLAGIQKASLELKGFYSYGYSQIDQIINQRFGQTNDVNVLVAPAGYPVLGPAILMPSVITKYDLDAKLKGAIDAFKLDVRGATCADIGASSREEERTQSFRRSKRAREAPRRQQEAGRDHRCKMGEAQREERERQHGE